MRFRDRRDAGRDLGALLQEKYGNRDDVLVLALPRGGVPVGFEVARLLRAPLDVFLVRKLGVPSFEVMAGFGVALSPDGRYIATGVKVSDQNRVLVWDADAQKPFVLGEGYPVQNQGDGPAALTYSEYGRRSQDSPRTPSSCSTSAAAAKFRTDTSSRPLW